MWRNTFKKKYCKNKTELGAKSFRQNSKYQKQTHQKKNKQTNKQITIYYKWMNFNTSIWVKTALLKIIPRQQLSSGCNSIRSEPNIQTGQDGGGGLSTILSTF